MIAFGLAGLLWNPYEQNYYPGVRSWESAQPVTIDAAQSLGGLDWHIGAPLERRSIQGVVLGPDGKPVSGVYIELKVEGYEENAALAEPKADGKFTLELLKNLSYTVQAASNWQDGQPQWHSHTLRISSEDVPLTITLDQPGKECEQCRKRKL